MTDLVTSGFVEIAQQPTETFWKISQCVWARHCPKCRTVIYYESNCVINPHVVAKRMAKHAHNKSTKCTKCMFSSSEYKENHRKVMSSINTSTTYREKMSVKMKGKNTWMRGRPMTEKLKTSISKANKGRPLSPEHKKNLRIAKASLILRKGLEGTALNTDSGSLLWFGEMKGQGWNFQLNYPLLDLGYFVDGYDESKHTIVEYDTPYHKTNRQQKKDTKRQQEIIEYFESTGHPLKKFIRVDATDNYKVKGVNIVYETN